eukprot:IDg4149t1
MPVADADSSKDASFAFDKLADPVADVNDALTAARMVALLLTICDEARVVVPLGVEELQYNSIGNLLSHAPTSRNLAEAPDMARSPTAETSRGQNLITSFDVGKGLVAQRIRSEGCAHVDTSTAKKPNEGPDPMLMRISLDRRYKYAVIVLAESINIVFVVGCEARGFSFTEFDDI